MNNNKSFIEFCKDVVLHRQHQIYEGQVIDLFGASIIVNVYNALNETNKKRLESMHFIPAYRTCIKLYASMKDKE
mgnify:CR=1 FL=1